jgi:hypothetical protein
MQVSNKQIAQTKDDKLISSIAAISLPELSIADKYEASCIVMFLCRGCTHNPIRPLVLSEELNVMCKHNVLQNGLIMFWSSFTSSSSVSIVISVSTAIYTENRATTVEVLQCNRSQ